MELKIANPKTTQKITVSDKIFNAKFNEGLVHEVLVACQAALRSGTKAQKTRAEVSGGGAKPWRQKGSGRARAGTIRSPIWRKGGVTFAAKPRDYAKKVNKKVYQSALRAIFSQLLTQERIVIVEDLTVSMPKTKELLSKVQELKVKNALILTEAIDENLDLASRNLQSFSVQVVKNISPLDLIAYENIILTVPALKQLEGWLG